MSYIIEIITNVFIDVSSSQYKMTLGIMTEVTTYIVLNLGYDFPKMSLFLVLPLC